MKIKLVFATNNPHKLEEISAILKEKVELYSLKDISCTADIPETADTLEGNALLKARYIYHQFGMNCFADDTGLEVESLDKEPGVYSARYAGDEKDPEANMHKLLENLAGKKNRKACFRTVIALILDGKEYLFEGKIEGHITHEKHGKSGFGYDPVFQPDGYEQTFAELGNEIKNQISHRALAINKLYEFLKQP